MKKHFFILLLWMVVQPYLYAQEKIGAELYKYFGTESGYQPIFHLQSPDLYAELRYNYEDAATLSLYAGKKFEFGVNIKSGITPMLGVSTGRFEGLSFALNTETEWEKFFASSQSQYSRATKKNTESFFFNWSELGFSISENFYTGLSVQYTAQTGLSEFKPGLFAGISFKRFQFPVYVFKPFQSDRCFIIGLIYEYNSDKKK